MSVQPVCLPVRPVHNSYVMRRLPPGTEHVPPPPHHSRGPRPGSPPRVPAPTGAPLRPVPPRLPLTPDRYASQRITISRMHVSLLYPCRPCRLDNTGVWVDRRGLVLHTHARTHFFIYNKIMYITYNLREQRTNKNYIIVPCIQAHAFFVSSCLFRTNFL